MALECSYGTPLSKGWGRVDYPSKHGDEVHSCLIAPWDRDLQDLPEAWICTCKGFRFSGHCWHREQAPDDCCSWSVIEVCHTPPTSCPQCGAPINETEDPVANFQKVKAAVNDEPEVEGDLTLEQVEKQLEALTSDLASNYEAMKEAEKAHNGEKDSPGFKQRFFNLATEFARLSYPREKRTVEVEAETEQEAISKAVQLNPTFTAEEAKQEGDLWVVLLESNPEYDKVTYVNSDGYEIKKAVGEKGASFLVDDFMEAQPEAADEVINASVSITVSLPSLEELKDVTIAELIEEGMLTPVYSLDDKKAERYVKDHPEALSVFAQYRIPGSPAVSLPTLKKAKVKS